MSEQTLIWIYIVLLVAGGLVGFLKAGSKISLMMSVVCAVPLILCEVDVIPMKYVLWILLALLVLFAWRLTKTKKFMPNGVLVIATLVAIILPRVLK